MRHPCGNESDRLTKNLKDLKEDGILIIDEDVVRKTQSLKPRFLGSLLPKPPRLNWSPKCMQTLSFGRVEKNNQCCQSDAFERAIADSVSKEAKENNIDAFRLGLELIKRTWRFAPLKEA